MSQSRYVMTEASGRPFMGLGALVTRLVHPNTVGSDRLGVSLVRMEPGDEIQRHPHDYEEAYYVIEGEGSCKSRARTTSTSCRASRSTCRQNRIHGQINTSSGPLSSSAPVAAARRGRSPRAHRVMPMPRPENHDLEHLAERAHFVRVETVRLISIAKVGHYASVFSCAEILAVLYYGVMRLSRASRDWPDRDRFLFGKGHAAAGALSAARRLRVLPGRRPRRRTRGSATRSATTPT